MTGTHSTLKQRLTTYEESEHKNHRKNIRNIIHLYTIFSRVSIKTSIQEAILGIHSMNLI